MLRHWKVVALFVLVVCGSIGGAMSVLAQDICTATGTCGLVDNCDWLTNMCPPGDLCERLDCRYTSGCPYLTTRQTCRLMPCWFPSCWE